MIKYWVLCFHLTFTLTALSQDSSDSTLLINATSFPDSVSKSSVVNKLEIARRKPNAKPRFRLKQGRKVWITLSDSRKNAKLVKARIIAIDKDQIKFHLADGSQYEVVYADSVLHIIAFTSIGRIILASAIKTITIAAAVGCGAIIIGIAAFQVVFTPIMFFKDPSMLQGYSFKWVGNAFKDIGELERQLSLPFRKKINFAEGEWQLKISEIALK